MQIENIQNSKTKLLSCTLTFLPCQFHSLFLFNFKKRFSLTREMNLQIKEFNCEKAGFRAIHTENDADRLISCRRIINDAKDFSTHQWNFLASIALSLRVISRFKGFLRLINLEISIFLEQIFTSGIILNETAKTKSVKFIYCTLKDILSTKTMKELCASRRFSFVFGCELSASAGNLLKLFSRYCKNWPMRVICRAGKWTEITVIPSHVFFILVKLESKKCKWYCCLLSCSATNFVSTSSVLRDITRCI